MNDSAGDEIELLVVDDDARSRKLLVSHLTAAGYQVHTAGDGPSAVQLALELEPAVVFLDVMMPGMTGLEVCRALKTDERTRLSQIMMITAMTGSSHHVAGLDTGADDYVTKPVRREEFLARTRALLRAHGLLRELEAARVSLSARNRELDLKKTLAQTVVHDLKSPLAGVLANLELLALQCAGQQSALDSVARCQASSTRMQAMILDLLDVDAFEDGRLVPRLQPIAAGDIVAAATREIGASEDIRIRLETARDGGPVQADPALLRRIMDNLLGNAIRHSPARGTVTVRVEARCEGILISVADAGPGVPEAEREAVFEKYAQSGLRRRGVSTNYGLGLTFCQLAVEAHGGTIWVESSPAGGALFQILLPAVVEAPHERELASAVHA